jgi:hypothetical protein
MNGHGNGGIAWSSSVRLVRLAIKRVFEYAARLYLEPEMSLEKPLDWLFSEEPRSGLSA